MITPEEIATSIAEQSQKLLGKTSNQQSFSRDEVLSLMNDASLQSFIKGSEVGIAMVTGAFYVQRTQIDSKRHKRHPRQH